MIQLSVRLLKLDDLQHRIYESQVSETAKALNGENFQRYLTLDWTMPQVKVVLDFQIKHTGV